MSLSKPEINYDTALYALQENVVLKQRLEEDKQQYIKRIERLQFDVNWQQKKLKELLGNRSANTIAFALLILLFVDFVFNVWFVFNLWG